MIRAGIIGGAAPKAGELIRLLLNHPDVELKWVSAGAPFADMPLTERHAGLVGETDLRFIDYAPYDTIDVLFAVTQPGELKAMIDAKVFPDELRIIDLSADYRLKGEGEDAHDFVYGLPELNRKPMVRGARRVSVPGSFATAIELALLPLAKSLMLNSGITATAVTSGGTDVTPIAPLAHYQLEEMRQTLSAVQLNYSQNINLIPLQGGHDRGLMAVIYLDLDVDLDQLRQMYEEYYDDHNFTFVVDSVPTLREVANTNKCLLHLQKVAGKLIVTSVIDNHLKGAAGQAVHAMNLLFGLHERVGLALKPSAV